MGKRKKLDKNLPKTAVGVSRKEPKMSLNGVSKIRL